MIIQGQIVSIAGATLDFPCGYTIYYGSRGEWKLQVTSSRPQPDPGLALGLLIIGWVAKALGRQNVAQD